MKKQIALLVTAGLLFTSAAASAEEWLWPVKDFYNISSGFGQRSFSYHKGMDVAGPEANIIYNAPILASKSGTVIEVGRNCTHNYPKPSSCGCGGGYGNYAYIQLPDGLITRYGHMTEVLVEEGQAVMQGDVIGTVGSTGSSSGHHLHFEIRDTANNPVNPMPQNPDALHTYEGSSAPKTESISYIYSLAPKTETTVLADGTISISAKNTEPDSVLIVMQFYGGNLISFDARPIVGKTEVFTKEALTDNILVFLKKGNDASVQTENILI